MQHSVKKGFIAIAKIINLVIGWLNWGLTPLLTARGNIMTVGDAYVFPGFLTPVLTQLFFPKPYRLLFSHASAKVRGENTPERKVASTGDRTRNHQVTSPKLSPLSHLGGAYRLGQLALFAQTDPVRNFFAISQVSFFPPPPLYPFPKQALVFFFF